MTIHETYEDEFTISAPGKAILFGEHAVVHGRTAVAASISLRGYLRVRRTRVTRGTNDQGLERDAIVSLDFPGVEIHNNWKISELPQPTNIRSDLANSEFDKELLASIDSWLGSQFVPGAQKNAALAFLYLFISIGASHSEYLAGITQLSFYMRSEIPLSAGLGSSATISVCLAAAMSHIFGIPNLSLHQINQYAFYGETCIHGNPSGVDNTVATFGSIHIFNRVKHETKTIALANGFKILVTNTGIPRSTKVLVANVAQLCSAYKTLGHYLLDAIHQISSDAVSVFEKSNSAGSELDTRVGELVRINQGLLYALGVSHPKIEEIVGLTSDIGDTKLTGAGGGGCTITLLRSDVSQDQIESTVRHLESEGFQVFSDVVMGGPGVQFSDQTINDFETIDFASLKTHTWKSIWN